MREAGGEARIGVMANRDNHYEAAFEAYLRDRRLPYVAVDEAKRSLLSNGSSIKNLDFIVSSPSGVTWLVDVKGRRFPGGDDQKQYCYCLSKPHQRETSAPHEPLGGIASRGAPTRAECHRPST